MKLRNKKTGEMGVPRIEYQEIYIDTENHMTYCYKTFFGMIEEWEDYKEPKEYFYIISSGEVNSISEDEEDEEDTKVCKEIGNYFETRKEAELAVRKLKAWKRLKDKGFRLLGYYHTLGETKSKGEIGFEMDDYGGTKQDLDLLFGGEE